MADGSQLVWNRISEKGLREVHLMLHGSLPKLEEWISAVCPDYAQDTVRWYHQEEKDLNLNHLFILWNAREVVEFDLRIFGIQVTNSVPDLDAAKNAAAPLKYGVLWWIGKDNVSFSADLAATLYFQQFGRMPEKMWMRTMPKGHDHVLVQDVSAGDQSKRHEQKLCRMDILQADWVPEERYLVVGIERERFDPVWKDGRYE